MLPPRRCLAPERLLLRPRLHVERAGHDAVRLHPDALGSARDFGEERLLVARQLRGDASALDAQPPFQLFGGGANLDVSLSRDGRAPLRVRRPSPRALQRRDLAPFLTVDAETSLAAAATAPSLQLPALFLVEVALARLWRAAGMEPVALLGHSLGEVSAACVAGVMQFEQALGLTVLRGRLFETAP